MTALRTRRWNDPPEPGDGLRVLVSRFRPRGVKKEAETWDVWLKELGPSTELHAAFYGKERPAVSWEEYRRRYLEEAEGKTEIIASLALHLREGKALTLLCSSACEVEARCHRSLLRELIERAV